MEEILYFLINVARVNTYLCFKHFRDLPEPPPAQQLITSDDESSSDSHDSDDDDDDAPWESSNAWDFLQKVVYGLGEGKGRAVSTSSVLALKNYITSKSKEKEM